MEKLQLGQKYYYLINSEDKFKELLESLDIDDYRGDSKYKGPGLYYVHREQSGMLDAYYRLRYLPHQVVETFLQKVWEGLRDGNGD